LENSVPFCVGLYAVTVLFPIEIWVLSINPLDSSLSSIGECFLKFSPQQLIKAVWFNWPYSISLRIMSLTMYIFCRYKRCELNCVVSI